MEILEELISHRLIYKGQKIYYSSVQRKNAIDIDYKEPTFLELYAPYKTLMSETAFARILGIGSSSLSEKKNINSSQRIIVNVFSKNQLTDDEKSECISFLKNKYSLGASNNQRERGIYYSEIQRNNAQDIKYEGPFFHTMYEELPMRFKIKCSEQDLAILLGIKGFLAFRGPNYKYKATLNIPISELTKEQREKILKYLIQRYSLYKGQKIYYSRKYAKFQDYEGPFIDEMFQELPEKIKVKLKIEDIINLLGIQSFNQTRAMCIFSTRILTDDEKHSYFDYLVDTYELTRQYSKINIFFSEVQKNNSADTDYGGPYLLDMYEHSPAEFRSKCTVYEMIQLLQTTKSFKNSTQNASNNKIVILINQELTPDENEAIDKIATEFEGRPLQYQSGEPSFKSLYEIYKLKLTEKEFAERLGISPYILETMKVNPEYSAIAVNMSKVEKAKNALRNITESRFYSLEELTNLCLCNEISIEDFVRYMDSFGRRTTNLYDILQRKGKLFISAYLPQTGKFTIRRSFIQMTHYIYDRIYTTLELKIRKSAFKLIGKYKPEIDKKDLIQIGLEFVFAQCGEIEKNFCESGEFANKDDEEEFWKYIIGKVKVHMRYAIFREKKASINFQKNKRHFSASTCDEYFLDDDIIYFEDEELIDWENDDTDIKASKLKNIIKKYIESGEYSSSEIINAIQNRFGISSKNMSELLAVLQNSMINSGIAKSSKSGTIVLGDTSEREM